MQTKRPGNSDLFITPVGFGSWAVGGGDWVFGWGSQDDAQSISEQHRRDCLFADDVGLTQRTHDARTHRRFSGR